MNAFFTHTRASGLLAHITSLPSVYGIGDIGPSSISFLNFLAKSGQSCWQFLPTGPTDSFFDNSPYMATSAFAGSPLLISPDLFVEAGYLERNDIHYLADVSEYQTNFIQVRLFKKNLLEKAFLNKSIFASQLEAFHQKSPWLDDYALFMALKEKFPARAWSEWPKEVARRNPATLKKLSKELKNRIDYYIFEQFEFSRQWGLLKNEAERLNIKLIGDIPIYVAFDSVDVWANQEIFVLNPKTLQAKNVSGVPPDYFSETGQRWGNPLYNWSSRKKGVQKKLYRWWADRFKALFSMVDIARIDHFRGFESYWSIPAAEKTAVNGVWRKGPGKKFFDTIFQELGKLDIIAEDLGMITPEVTRLRKKLNFPGMKVLQFAFDGNPTNSFLPHNFESPDCVIYTGTHDNDTSVGWFLSNKLNDSQRKDIKRYANRALHDDSEIHRNLIYLALSSSANLAIFPLQDILGFGNDCKMNSPGQKKGNWAWRCAGKFLDDHTAGWLRDDCRFFGRLPENNKTDNDKKEPDESTLSPRQSTKKRQQ